MEDPALQGPEGAVIKQKLLDQGQAPDAVDLWQQDQMKQQYLSGTDPQEIQKYWGVPDPDFSKLKAQIDLNIHSLTPPEKESIAANPGEVFAAGFQHGALGLTAGKPTLIAPQDQGLMGKILYGAGQGISDIPLIVAGAIGGAAAGAPAGPIGALAAGGAGSAAVPEAFRQLMMEHYSSPDGPWTWKDFWSKAANIMMETGKAAVEGGVAAPVGGTVGRAVLGVAGSKVLSTAADIATMAASGTMVGGALNGKAPDADDFVAGAVQALGFHAAGTLVGATQRFVPSDAAAQVTENLRDAYVATGQHPIVLGQLVDRDAVIRGEVFGPTTATGERLTPALDRLALREPPPYAKPAEEPKEPLEGEVLPPEHTDLTAAKGLIEREQAQDTFEARNMRMLTNQGDGEWIPPAEPPEPPEPPEGGPKLIEGPEPEPIQLNWQSGHQQVMDIIAPELKKGLIPEWLSPREWLAKFQSQLTPARELDRRLGLDPRQIGIEDMFRQVYASRERAGAFFQYGTIRPGDNAIEYTSDNSFKKAYQQVAKDGGTVDGSVSYRLAKRTIEKARQGIQTGVDLEAARLRMTEPNVEEKYAAGNKIMQATKNGAIDYAVDSNMFSPEGARAMKELNQEHIVFRRVLDPDYRPPVPGRSFNPRSPTKVMEGSERKIVDPVTADIDNMHTMIAMSDRNMARLNLISRLNEFNQAQIRAGKEATFNLNKVEIKDLDNGNTILGELQDANGNPIPDTIAKGAYPLAIARKFIDMGGPAKGQFLVFYKGHPEVWHTTDPDIAEVMNMTFAGQPDKFFEPAIKLAGLQRAGITAQPIFALRALTHQQLAGSIFGPESAPPFFDTFRGLMDTINQREAFQRFVANGGAGSALIDMDTNYVRRQVSEIFDETNTWDSIRNMARHPYDAWRGFQHMLHTASGVGAFKRLENQGFSALKAAIQTRTSYLDHAEPLAAAWATTYSRMVPWMTVGLKDMEQFARGIQDRPFSTIMKGMGYITLPTVLNSIANYFVDKSQPEGQKYSDLPEWRRMLFMNLPPINGVRIPIPRPYVGGFIFGAFPEMFINWLMNDNRHAFEEWGKNMLAQYVPNFSPTIATPIAEDAFNTNFMTMRPLVKDSLERADSYMQYTDNTTEASKKIAQLLGPAGANVKDLSPIKMDNYIQQWLGPFPMQLMRILEAPFKDPGRPKEWADEPLLGSFLAREGGTGSDVLDKLYTKFDSFDKAHADFELAQQHGNPEEIKQTATVAAMMQVSGMKESLRQQLASIHAIWKNKNLTDIEKLKWGDQLSAAYVGSAKRMLETLDRIQ